METNLPRATRVSPVSENTLLGQKIIFKSSLLKIHKILDFVLGCCNLSAGFGRVTVRFSQNCLYALKWLENDFVADNGTFTYKV